MARLEHVVNLVLQTAALQESAGASLHQIIGTLQTKAWKIRPSNPITPEGRDKAKIMICLPGVRGAARWRSCERGRLTAGRFTFETHQMAGASVCTVCMLKPKNVQSVVQTFCTAPVGPRLGYRPPLRKKQVVENSPFAGVLRLP